MDSKEIKFVDSSVFTDEETDINTKAYKSELDHLCNGTELMKLGDNEIKEGIDKMLGLGYSREAIGYVMKILEENNRVVRPHYIKNYQEFNSVEDAYTEHGRRLNMGPLWKKLDNGHVLVYKLPDATLQELYKYIV